MVGEIHIELVIALLVTVYLIKLLFCSLIESSDGPDTSQQNAHYPKGLRLIHPGVIVGLEKKSLFGQQPVRR